MTTLSSDAQYYRALERFPYDVRWFPRAVLRSQHAGVQPVERDLPCHHTTVCRVVQCYARRSSIDLTLISS